jgi:hypothetical protein
MKMFTKISLVCAFAGAGVVLGAGYNAYEKHQREKEIEALLASGSICTTKHNDDRTLTSTVDIERALSVVRLGEISFSETVATVTLNEKEGVATISHDFTFDFGGKGAICDETSPICSPMDVLTKDDKTKLTAAICERATGLNGAAFSDQICTPKP